MFTFTRESTDYEIKYINQGDDDLLVCAYLDGVSTKWRSAIDTYDLNHEFGIYYNDEKSFLEAFLNNLNASLDRAHGETEIDSPQGRLTALIKNKLSFNGKHVLLG